MSPAQSFRTGHHARLYGHLEPEGSRLVLLAALEEFAVKGCHACATHDGTHDAMSPRDV